MTGPGHPVDAHLVLAFDGTVPPPWVIDVLAERPVAGFTLFRHANVESAAQVAELTAALSRAAGGEPPLLLATDQETGQLCGLGDEATAFPGNMALGATGDADLARRVGAAIGREMAAMGLNVDYAPVCDVASNPANPSLGIRAFGDDPRLVADLAAATIDGLQSAGVAATAKHFPGKGEAVVDPHHALPRLDLSRRRLDEIELVPFRAAIDAGVGLVMAGHYSVPSVTGDDVTPGSLSHAMISGLLRADLGFDGVVISDALDMGAINPDPGRGPDVAAALSAGIDLLLCARDPDAQERLRSGLVTALATGRLDAAALASSRARVTRLRDRLRTVRPALDVVGCLDHRRLAEEVAMRSVTLVSDRGRLLPLPVSGRILAVMPEPADLTPADTSSTVAPGLARGLRMFHPSVTEVITAHMPSSSEIEGVVEQARRHDAVVIGTLSAGPEQAALVNAVLATGVTTVTAALRTPYDLAAYPRPGTHLCTYSIHPESMAALAAVIFGRVEALGRLPVRMPDAARLRS